ncbi:ASCH domain-containing protein [Streptomyces sp. enrichment culture]|uniref:ASCH domain-containing protein n=1 Tax=Streptomyces sp. enrichment culture TaxID=1795815 RepID=UPI003F5607F0
MWPRVDGMRAMELGTPGEMRGRLNALVLAGTKTATTGLLEDYVEDTEGLEFIGERLALLGDEGQSVGVIEVTGVQVTTFGEVTWEHARAEGEGDTSLEEWRTGHRRFWSREGALIQDDTAVVCVAFRLVKTA